MPNPAPCPQGGRRRVCLYFGSFNPLHIAHLQLARYMVERGLCDELWLVLSPVNPLKDRASQLPFAWRADYIEQAIASDPRLRLCRIEAMLPEPHYTIHTLRALRTLYPVCSLSLLIGGDNLGLLPRWYDYERLLRTTKLYVYPRQGVSLSLEHLAGLPHDIYICHDVPESPLGATDIRRAALEGRDVRELTALPERWEELCEQIKLLDRQYNNDSK